MPVSFASFRTMVHDFTDKLRPTRATSGSKYVERDGVEGATRMGGHIIHDLPMPIAVFTYMFSHVVLHIHTLYRFA